MSTHIISLFWIVSFTILKLKGINSVVDGIAIAIILFYYGYWIGKGKEK